MPSPCLIGSFTVTWILDCTGSSILDNEGESDDVILACTFSWLLNPNGKSQLVPIVLDEEGGGSAVDSSRMRFV